MRGVERKLTPMAGVVVVTAFAGAGAAADSQQQLPTATGGQQHPAPLLCAMWPGPVAAVVEVEAAPSTSRIPAIAIKAIRGR
jgi:hypothetical protein